MRPAKKVAAIAFTVIIAQFCMGRTAAEAFADAPFDVAGIFDRNTRLDMIDYYNSRLSTPSANTLQGRSYIKSLTPESILIAVSDSTSMQIAMVPLKNDTIIAVIESIKTPYADSSVRFYRSDWSAFPQPEMPQLIDFVQPAKRKQAIKGGIPEWGFIAIEYLPESNKFKLTNNTAAYYIAPEQPEGMALLRDCIYLTFDGKKFKPAK